MFVVSYCLKTGNVRFGRRTIRASAMAVFLVECIYEPCLQLVINTKFLLVFT